MQTTTVGNVTLTYGTRANAIRIGRTGIPFASSPSLQEPNLTANHTAHGASSTSIGAGRIVNTDIISAWRPPTSTSIAATITHVTSVINTGRFAMPSSTQTPESQTKPSPQVPLHHTQHRTPHHIGHHRIRRTHYYRYIDYWRRKLGHRAATGVTATIANVTASAAGNTAVGDAKNGTYCPGCSRYKTCNRRIVDPRSYRCRHKTRTKTVCAHFTSTAYRCRRSHRLRRRSR